MTHTNGRLAVIESDFRRVKDTVDSINEQVEDNSAKLQQIEIYIKNLNSLPIIANSLKIQTYLIGALFALLALIVVPMVMKGTNIKMTIPGWFEIHGNDSRGDK